jgi:hypothetical protein
MHPAKGPQAPSARGSRCCCSPADRTGSKFGDPPTLAHRGRLPGGCSPPSARHKPCIIQALVVVLFSPSRALFGRFNRPRRRAQMLSISHAWRPTVARCRRRWRSSRGGARVRTLGQQLTNQPATSPHLAHRHRRNAAASAGRCRRHKHHRGGRHAARRC